MAGTSSSPGCEAPSLLCVALPFSSLRGSFPLFFLGHRPSRHWEALSFCSVWGLLLLVIARPFRFPHHRAVSLSPLRGALPMFALVHFPSGPCMAPPFFPPQAFVFFSSSRAPPLLVIARPSLYLYFGALPSPPCMALPFFPPQAFLFFSSSRAPPLPVIASPSPSSHCEALPFSSLRGTKCRSNLGVP